MKKFCLLLLTVCLFSVTTFAHNKRDAAELTPFDLVGPVITYTALAQSSCTSTRMFTATITDIDGVNTTPGTRPRVYYKRTGDVNNFFDNTSGTGGWKYAEATNAGSTFTFIIDYSLLSGGVTSGQTIQYFVIAQDLVATPNIGVGSATTFSTPPASVALTAANFPAGGAINIYNIVNALPTFMQIGAFADFATLTGSGGLFNAINNVGLSGNTIVEIADPLITENNAFPLYQVQNTGCGAGAVSLLIKPAAGVSPTITGSRANEPIIRILSSNVTIDGSNNGTTSRNLTLTNTNATSPSVILLGSLNSATAISNSTLKNTICINTMSITNCVVVSDGNVGGNPGYFSNITIQNNSIQRSYIGLNCAAVPGAGNGSILITENDLNATSTNQLGGVGIYAEGLNGATISNNNIGNFDASAAGPKYGVWIIGGTTNTLISGNTINSISGLSSGSNATVYGIAIAGFSGAATAASSITIEKNKISNIKNTNASGYPAYGIGLLSNVTTANITVANNFIFDVAGVGGSATLSRGGYGIYLGGGGGGYKIYYNSINLNTAQSSAVGVPSAIMINGITTASSLDIRNNILANTQTTGATARYAIYSANANTIFLAIDNNDYYITGPNLGFIGSARATLADIQTGFGGNISPVNVLPAFVSATDLHLTPANCFLDGKATPVTVTTDIDAVTRNAVTPDIGADEFTSSGIVLAGIAGAPVCRNQPVAITGTTYYQPASCNLIARVLPSGADPVAGNINTCVTLDATQQYFNGEPYVQRHFDIEPAIANETTTSATVTLYFTDDEFVDYNTNNPVWPPLPTVAGGANGDANRANLKITQFHGVASTTPSIPGNYPGVRVLINPGAANVFWNGSYWEVTFNVSGFSGFYVHSNFTNTPLPVAVNYLTGRKQGSSHLLNWKVTCTGSAGVTMMLERSADGRNFSGIHSITASALRCQQPFDYTDANPLNAMNYYRVKVIDTDGKVTYSTTVALLNAVKGFDIISIAPNPVTTNGNFKLNVASATAGKMEIVIFDMQGRLVKRQSISLIAGFNSVPVKVDELSSGSYTIRANAAGEQIKMIRFVKQ